MLISKCLLCNNFYFFVRQRQIVYPAAAPLYTPTPAQANTLALTGVSAAILRIAPALSAFINSINLTIGQTIDQLKYYTTTFSPKLHLKVHCFKNSQWCSFAHIKGKSLPNQGIIVCQFKYL